MIGAKQVRLNNKPAAVGQGITAAMVVETSSVEASETSFSRRLARFRESKNFWPITGGASAGVLLVALVTVGVVVSSRDKGKVANKECSCLRLL